MKTINEHTQDYVSFLINKVKPAMLRNDDTTNKMSNDWVIKTYKLYTEGKLNNQGVDKVLDGYYLSVHKVESVV